MRGDGEFYNRRFGKLKEIEVHYKILRRIKRLEKWQEKKN